MCSELVSEKKRKGRATLMIFVSPPSEVQEFEKRGALWNESAKD